MTETNQGYQSSYLNRSAQFNSPDNRTKDSKFRYEDLDTDYKRNNEQMTSSNNKSQLRSNYRKENTERKTEPGSRYQERRSSSSERKRQDENDPTLDNIQSRIKEVGQRLRTIHLQTIGKQPGALEEERRELRKELIDLDHDHKMFCAKKHIYGKNGPITSLGTSTITFSPSESSRLRLAEIEAELSLIRSRRLLDLQSDLLFYDYYLDWPYYSSYYWYRPYRSLRYYDYYSYPYYSSLRWL